MIERRQTTWMDGGLALLVLVFMGLAVLLPLALLVSAGLPPGPDALEGLRGQLSDIPLQEAFLRSLGVAFLAGVLASLVALPLAPALLRVPRHLRGMLMLFGLFPLVIPPFLGAALVRHFASLYNGSPLAEALGRLEVMHSGLVLALVFAVHYLPLVLFCLLVALERIPRDLGESARSLGAGRVTAWRCVTLPLAAPACLMGAAIVTLKVIEDIGAPLVLGIEGMLAPQLLLQFAEGGLEDPRLPTTALVLLMVSLAITALAWSGLLPPLGTETRPPSGRRRRSGPLAALWWFPLLVAFALLSLAPAIWLGLSAFDTRWTSDLLPTIGQPPGLATLLGGDPGTFATTLLYAACAGLLLVTIGLPAGIATAGRTAAGRLTRFLSTMMFAVPGAVLALGLLYLGRQLGQPLTTHPGVVWAALALVVALKMLPLAQRLLAGPVRDLQNGALDAGRSLGAHGAALYLRIALPGAAAALSAVFLLGATAAALELSAALLLIREPGAPVARVLFDSIRAGASAVTWTAPALLLTVGAIVAAALGLFLLRRRCCRERMAATRQTTPWREEP